MKWYGLAFLFYTLVGVGFCWGYLAKKQFNYPSPVFFDTYGLDVSHHQGKVQWSKVDSKIFKFVYLKATEGESFKDKRFWKNYAQAKKNGLRVGGYHFWTFCKSAEKQLQNIRSVIPSSSEDLVPVIDMESAYSCGMEKDHDRVISDLLKVNEQILKIYGALPVIYTTKEFVGVHPEIFEAPNTFWLRSLVGPPLYKKDWGIWQYYNGANVNGVRGRVDVNVLSKNLSLDAITQR